MLDDWDGWQWRIGVVKRGEERMKVILVRFHGIGSQFESSRSVQGGGGFLRNAFVSGDNLFLARCHVESMREHLESMCDIC